MFAVGREYPRNALLCFVGSKQGQSGIIWGALEPGCVIATSGGRHSARAGYLDERLADGRWVYFGQGEKGDQDPETYANSLLSAGERTVLLFSTREPTSSQVKQQGNHSKKYRFEGMFNVLSWEWFIPMEGKRISNRLIKFELVPTTSDYHEETLDVSSPDFVPSPSSDFKALRAELSEPKAKSPKNRPSAQYFARSKKIKDYALARAAGVCEACSSQAPFTTPNGQPFLEVHHLDRLADDGPDIPLNVAGICPNCHREAHYGKNLNVFRKNLHFEVAKKEANLDTIKFSANQFTK
ncbi:HNH endonuclease [Geomonas agri]|uniref:HNH endonuclease n=1 Tax=Geomonas agri TaxID=2873702 RepID=UPI001CD63EB1|nr:HNH endonuclease signature motif containing protein [Geomonas agri]